jgi:hypothetical protein
VESLSALLKQNVPTATHLMESQESYIGINLRTNISVGHIINNIEEN